MKDSKIRLYGARLKRLFIHFVVFWGLLVVYSMAAAETSAVIVFIVFSVIGIGGLIMGKSSTFDHERELQVTRETIEADPKASGEELRMAYQKRMGRDKRLDALACLLFAGFVALWILVLKISDAPDLTMLIGWCVLTPAPLVLALVLLISSFLPRKKPVPSELEDYIRDRKDQQALSERLERPDLRARGLIPCRMDQPETPTFESVCESLKPLVETRGIAALFVIVRILVYPLPFGYGILGAAVWGVGTLLFLIFGSILFMFVFYFKLRRRTRGMNRYPIKAKTFRRLKAKGTLEEDRVLSAIPSVDDGTTLELCFDRAGTIQCKCSIQDYRKLLERNGRTAYLLMLGKSVQAVFFAEEDEVEVESPGERPIPLTWSAPPRPEAPPLEEEEIARIVEEGGYPSDEQIREAALKRLEAKDPAVIKVWTDDLDAWHELWKRSAQGLSQADNERRTLLYSNLSRRIMGEDEFRDLREMDSKLREEGVTREEIVAKQRLRVPFRAYLPLVIAVVGLIAGIAVVRLIENSTGAELGWVYVALSTVSGVVSLRCATAMLNTRKVKKDFRKLKSAYDDPRFWSAMIEVEAYRIFNDQWNEAHSEQEES